ncbi:site-2 protease family protein [Nocardioides sp.]|uniref:M50 family metallopeptidase n=1 Tax=Nocardioides sp. TaxID=35761 RepID=UPI0025F5F05E|nr:site-2 protease family protein [Nocardioides sp.]
MDTLLWVFGALVFVVAILASIGLHELGHMIPAKAFGGKVTQYFIGFGPTVWSTRRGETEYGVKAIPLGGYVKIVGMLPPGAADLADEVTVDAAGNTVTKVRKSNTGLFTQLISDARAAEWELVGPEDSDRLFYKMTWWKKVVVMAGGPTVNILIAFFVFWAIFATYGNAAEARPDSGRPVLAEVSDCVIPYEEQRLECTDSDPVSPAAEAGLEPGDVITSFNGVAVTSWDQLRELIRANADGEAVIGYERDGVALTGTTSTTVELRPESEEDRTLREVGFLGVTPTTHLESGGPLYTVQQMDEMAVETVKAMANLPGKVWGVAKAIVGVQERDQDSPVSIVGGSRFSGEIVSSDELEVTEKVVFFGSLVAGFNFFIGMFNFIPLLPLDGGHIASALWEAVRRGFARLFGRPDPGYVDAAKLLPVAYVVASCLLVLSAVLIVGDIVVPVSIS